MALCAGKTTQRIAVLSKKLCATPPASQCLAADGSIYPVYAQPGFLWIFVGGNQPSAGEDCCFLELRCAGIFRFHIAFVLLATVRIEAINLRSCSTVAARKSIQGAVIKWSAVDTNRNVALLSPLSLKHSRKTSKTNKYL